MYKFLLILPEWEHVILIQFNLKSHLHTTKLKKHISVKKVCR